MHRPRLACAAKGFALVIALLGAGFAIAQGGEFPARMHGSWKTPTKNGDSTIELLAMTSPDKAKVKVTLTGGTIGPQETP